MAYSCYVRHEGRGVVEVEPTVTIRFDQITTITRNRMRRVLQDNYNPYGWGSKPSAILDAMQGHYKVFNSLMDPDLINHPDFDKEEFEAKALLVGYEFKIPNYYMNPKAYRYMHGSLMLKNPNLYSADQLEQRIKQMERLTQDALLPIARSFIDHTKLAPIMEALDNRQPYIFTGVNMR